MSMKSTPTQKGEAMEGWAGVVLAAGVGTRMKSRTPKVLHPVCGKPMLAYPVEALRRAGLRRILVVVSPQTEEGARALLGTSVDYVRQDLPLGTGHALLQTRSSIGGVGDLLVLNGDLPLIRPDTLLRLMESHRRAGATVTLLTSTSCPPEGMGRVIRDASGRVVSIVEEAEATASQRDNPEVNGGAYCLRASWAWPTLGTLQPRAKGEVYLTDLVAQAASQGQVVEACATDGWEVQGVNDRLQLARVEGVMRARIRERWMLEGVTMLDPASTFIDADVHIGQDTVIYPNTILLGRTQVGEACHIGPSSVVRDSTVGNGCRVTASFLEEATLEDGSDVGPFSHLRPGAWLGPGVHVGNFAEVKNSRLGRGTLMGHFSYVGDALIGERVNIGAGTITCNFDGVRKNQTVVEDGAFIGSDTMLVAPVTVGAGAATGAGAVVTRDIPPRALAVGVPARVVRQLPEG